MLSTELKEIFKAESNKIADRLHAKYDHLNTIPIQKLAAAIETLAHELYEEYKEHGIDFPLPELSEWARRYADQDLFDYVFKRMTSN